MFRKLVSNLSFSPALITQVGFYAHRLRQEEVTRRMTLLFVALALIVQSLAVFSPPESANASSEQDLIRGGIRDVSDLIARYDKNADDIKDIYTTLGIERRELEATKPGSVNSKASLYSLSRYSQYSTEQGETNFTYKSSTGGTALRYISPLSLADTSPSKIRNGTSYDALIGQSEKLGWFAILTSNASPVTKGYPATITPSSSSSVTTLSRTITAINITQGGPADAITAKPFDKISYTMTVQNSGKTAAQTPLSLNLSDSLEYANLIDGGGAQLNQENKVLSWPSAAIAPGNTEERTFTLQVLQTIPATPTGQSNSNSYDCIMSTTYGSTDRIQVDCPVVKGAENIIGDLPMTGLFVNVVFALTLSTTVAFFYFRTRQLKKEIRLIRHKMNTGTI